MKRIRPLPIGIAALMVLATAPARGAEPGFRERVAPIVGKYCVGCHGPEKPKGKLNLAAFADEEAVLKDRRTWAKVLEAVEGGDMPPEGKPRPSEAEAEGLTAWLQAKISTADCQLAADPGRVTMRRLNRAEYNNTIRDLVGVPFRPADDFPQDDVGYGFDNIGDVLTLSPILMERYLAAAEEIADRAIVVRTTPPNTTLQAGDAEGGSPFDAGKILASEGELKVKFEAKKGGVYRFRIRAFGQQAGKDPARMEVRVNGKPASTLNKAPAKFDVTATLAAPAIYETPLILRPGQKVLSVAFLNDYYNPDEPDEQRRDRNLVVEWFEVQGPYDSRPIPPSQDQILFRKPKDRGEWADCARDILARFAARAFRRPATPDEVARLIRFVDQAGADGEPFERGIQLAMTATLISPHFLYRVEVRRGPEDRPEPLDDYELAARLAYFLWSSMPDEELTGLAQAGTLHEPAILEAQARRMLRDPKARALTENFAGQWLQTRNLRNVTPDKARFPDFDEPLRQAMRAEAELFFEEVVREDRSILTFLDADFTYLNARLARHYGIDGVQGKEIRRVTLKDGRRGGIVTMGSVLTVTSNPTRTSPVKRGKWILDQVFNAPPPPPPPGVEELKDDPKAVEEASLRKRMEQHRANAECAACHAKMDPLGFGLENFDAVGAWREKDGPFPVDATGTLPSGRSFAGPAELKKVLLAKDKEFARCLAGKLLTYALGRGLGPDDDCNVDRIAAEVAADGHKFSRLVVGVVASESFRKSGRGEAK